MGKVTNPKNENLKDLSAREVAIMMPLLIFIFWIGVYPNTFLDKMNPALDNMIKEVKGKQHIAMMVEGVEQTVTQISVND